MQTPPRRLKTEHPHKFMPRAKTLRHRLPATNRTPRPPPQTSPSPSCRRRASKPIQILRRCSSEPTLLAVSGDDEHRNLSSPEYTVLSRSAMNFPSPEALAPPPPLHSHEIEQKQGYNRDAKVVVNVIVEGSPGPVRTMVKLGSSVDETIRLVISKYGEQHRTPKLSKDAASAFELHNSYFSLQSLKKSDIIGDMGSRSFYLRKCNSNSSINHAASITPEITLAKTISTGAPSTPALSFFSSFLRKINKIIRRTRNFWKILGCMHCGG